MCSWMWKRGSSVGHYVWVIVYIPGFVYWLLLVTHIVLHSVSFCCSASGIEVWLFTLGCGHFLVTSVSSTRARHKSREETVAWADFCCIFSNSYWFTWSKWRYKRNATLYEFVMALHTLVLTRWSACSLRICGVLSMFSASSHGKKKNVCEANRNSKIGHRRKCNVCFLCECVCVQWIAHFS